MTSNTNHKSSIIQKRFEGYLNTPCLWEDDLTPKLIPFKINSKSCKINIDVDEKLRLGKYVERLVSFELKQQENISILGENIQIQQNNITLGELDCLLLKNNEPIHLEVIYKFYLYDSKVGNTEIDHYIGPNRKDSLKEKLAKLKDKQLPILHSSACKPYLEKLDLQLEHIAQQVYFKAQLFVPFSYSKNGLKTLNSKCIVGFYIRKNELIVFKDCKFYIPNKKDWLIIPHTNIEWLNFNTLKNKVENYLDRQFSPLLWVKLKNGELKKVFLVWW